MEGSSRITPFLKLFWTNIASGPINGGGPLGGQLIKQASFEEKKAQLGKDYYPYGLEENRHTLEVYLRWCFEQGIAKRPLTPEELFAPETRTRFKV